MTTYDIVIWGATGYTGGLTCDYLASHNAEEVKWAVAGRNASKLEALVATLRMKHDVDIPYIISDTEDRDSMRAMCSKTRTLIALAGPYTISGEAAVRACIETNTHYLDITAELPWAAAMAQKYGGEAEARRVKMVSSCGFDFVPNDIMMMQLQKSLSDPNARALYSSHPREVIHSFHQSTPFVSGGTAHSGVQMVRSKGLGGIVPYYVNPYDMCEKGSPGVKTSPLTASMNRYQLVPAHVQSEGYYCVPFVMSSLMSKYIHWSNQLQGYPWGANLVYRGGERRDYAVMAYLYSLVIWIQFFLLVCLAQIPAVWKWLPVPGEGPAIEKTSAYMEADLIAYVDAEPPVMEKTVKIKWRLDGMEAYGAAALFVVEAAKMLTVEPNNCTPMFGWISPSAALGMKYLDRLKSTELKMTVDDMTCRTS